MRIKETDSKKGVTVSSTESNAIRVTFSNASLSQQFQDAAKWLDLHGDHIVVRQAGIETNLSDQNDFLTIYYEKE